MLAQLGSCFLREAVRYSAHARHEMRTEPRGKISEAEVREAVLTGEVIMDYQDDKPLPSILILGFSRNRRPIHLVAAYDPADDVAIVITAYEPTPDLWFDLRKRRRA